MSTGSSISAHTAGAGWRERLRPSCGPPRPLRASRAGVWMAPAATTIVGASTRRRPPPAVEASTPSEPPRGHARVGGGAGGVGLRDVRQADVLLRVRRTAVRADAGADAAA